MFGIGKIDFRPVARVTVESTNIQQEDDGIALASAAAGVGRALLAPVAIAMVVKWEGLDVIGCGRFDLSIRRPAILPNTPPAFYRYDTGIAGWVSSLTEVFYPEATFRLYLPQWRGAFQLNLQITAVGDYPAKVTAIHYGYHTIGDFLDYTIKYQLSQFLSVPVNFLRTIRVNGREFPIPKGFDPNLITNPRAFQVGIESNDSPLIISSNNFVLPAAVVNAVHHIYFDYSVPIDSNNEHIPQIETVPSAFFRGRESTNLKFLNSKTAISIDTQTTRILQIPYLSDLRLDVLVFGDTNADANAVANAMATKIAQTGGFWNPGFNYDCIVQLVKPVVPSPYGGSASSNPNSGLLFSNTLKLKLANMPHGVFFTDTERIERVDPDYIF